MESVALEKPTVVVKPELCKGCGLCISSCPAEVLSFHERFNTKGYKPVEVTDMERCTGCALCAVVCPDVVFTVYREGRRVKEPTREAVATA